ncbi:MAG: PilN domain-containing protein [Thermomonas sp.]|nr:PilN domain-containing protein [Thermomonas sp.]
MSTMPTTYLRRFFAWWGRSLLEWLPVSLRRTLGVSQDRVLLHPNETLQLVLQREERLHPLGELPLPLPQGGDPLAVLLSGRVANLPRWLALPASLGLRRELTLPAAARERLRDVLTFEVERQTPFALADVLYDGRVLHPRADGQLQAELVVLPRAQLAAATARWPGVDLALAGLDLAAESGRPLGVNLLPQAQRARRKNPWRLWNLGLLLLAVFALCAALSQLLDNRAAAAAELQKTISQREPQARSVSAQRQQIMDAVEGGAHLAQQRNGRASAVEVIDALAQRMPDGTYLEKLSIDGDQLTLIGLSNQAAALVGQLEGAPQWSSPALSGPLQQEPRTRMDRFTLVAKLKVATTAAPEEAAHATH